MTEQYLIWSVEHEAWWGPDRSGYYGSIASAGRYTREEALHVCISAMPGTSTQLGALPELPVPLHDVQEMLVAYDEMFPGRPEVWR